VVAVAKQRVSRQWNGPKVVGELRGAQVEGLTVGAEHLLQVSRTVVPLEEGTLERSGEATVDEADRVAAVSYDTPYAVIQHEDLTFRHAPGRTAKYLETPMHTERATILALIAAEARRAMRS
jgi:hypothetical protein